MEVSGLQLVMAQLSSTSLFASANLQSYYRLEDLTDSKGSNTLTNNNTVTFTAAKYANGANLGSTDTDKSLTTTATYSIDGGACSLTCWVQLNTEIAAGEYRFVNIGNSSTDTEYYISYQYNAGTRRLVFGRGKVGVANEESYYTITLGTTLFYFLVLTYSGTNIRGYVNSVLQSGPTAASGSGSAGNSGLAIGGNVTPGPTFNSALAIVDDFGIFNAQLLQADIDILYAPNGGGAFFSL